MLRTTRGKNLVEMSIIIPARNEEAGIESVLQSVLALGLTDFEVIVVDGASVDGTAKVAEKYPVRVLLQPERHLGKGCGLRLGFFCSEGRKVVWIDADDTYPTAVVPRMVRELDTYDVVVCSRKFGKEHMPKFNRLGNWLFKVLIKSIYGFKGNDPCTGLYGIRKEYLERMSLTSARFAIEPEISIKVGRMKLKTLDIPIKYSPRVGDTKLNPIKVGFEDMWTIVRLVGWRPK